MKVYVAVYEFIDSPNHIRVSGVYNELGDAFRSFAFGDIVEWKRIEYETQRPDGCLSTYVVVTPGYEDIKVYCYRLHESI